MTLFIEICIQIIVLTIFAFIQAYICKNVKNKKIGLILPIGSFILALVPILSIIITFIISILFSNNENSILVGSSIWQIFNTILLFVILLIPSIVFTLIYKHYEKNRQKDN